MLFYKYVVNFLIFHEKFKTKIDNFINDKLITCLSREEIFASAENHGFKFKTNNPEIRFSNGLQNHA